MGRRRIHANDTARVAAWRAAHPESRESSRQRMRAWRERNPGFGLTPERLLALLEAQDYRCAICGRQPKPHGRRLAIDHDHTTGIVRGLLCYRCNTAIGLLGDDPNVAYRAARYLDGDR